MEENDKNYASIVRRVQEDRDSFIRCNIYDYGLNTYYYPLRLENTSLAFKYFEAENADKFKSNSDVDKFFKLQLKKTPSKYSKDIKALIKQVESSKLPIELSTKLLNQIKRNINKLSCIVKSPLKKGPVKTQHKEVKAKLDQMAEIIDVLVVKVNKTKKTNFDLLFDKIRKYVLDKIKIEKLDSEYSNNLVFITTLYESKGQPRLSLKLINDIMNLIK